MDTFIRVAEVWQPSADGSVLEHAGGCYDAVPAFGALSRSMCFGRAEGLPGSAWDEGRPLLWNPLPQGRFLRAGAAAAAGLSSALALPYFRDGAIAAVAVLICADPGAVQGAIELWHNDARVTGDLRLADGVYSPSGTALEADSRDAWLPRGHGAPGRAWQKGSAIYIDDVRGERSFLRAQTAADAGMVRALSLPCASVDGHTWVVSLLSSQRTPIARRVEGWTVAPDARTLQRAFGFCEQRGRLPVGDEAPLPLAEAGALGDAVRRGVPVVQRGDAGSMLVLPLPDEGGVGEVVALTF